MTLPKLAWNWPNIIQRFLLRFIINVVWLSGRFRLSRARRVTAGFAGGSGHLSGYLSWLSLRLWCVLAVPTADTSGALASVMIKENRNCYHFSYRCTGIWTSQRDGMIGTSNFNIWLEVMRALVISATTLAVCRFSRCLNMIDVNPWKLMAKSVQSQVRSQPYN